MLTDTDTDEDDDETERGVQQEVDNVPVTTQSYSSIYTGEPEELAGMFSAVRRTRNALAYEQNSRPYKTTIRKLYDEQACHSNWLKVVQGVGSNWQDSNHGWTGRIAVRTGFPVFNTFGGGTDTVIQYDSQSCASTIDGVGHGIICGRSVDSYITIVYRGVIF